MHTGGGCGKRLSWKAGRFGVVAIFLKRRAAEAQRWKGFDETVSKRLGVHLSGLAVSFFLCVSAFPKNFRREIGSRSGARAGRIFRDAARSEEQ